ncbi:phage tail protein [Ilyobacter polytropus]|uniref:Prophage minor tail Z family protein n=1 Tax=Ilyobacter polytropus (strain ATCC 51220 / DSM 2926 / LMG 16218 / CuHBu1) TaxID=572544 RepID=E3HBL9_ILYPC|nr:phage tail protein [Ilyobacter polytropus]ADO83715.1 conserved hypothetical protein [Ilyobacter polytropus DSM 2926]
MITIDPMSIRVADYMLKGVSKGVVKSLYRSLNRANSTAKTTLSKEIRKRYYVKAKTVKKDVSVIKANSSSMNSGIRVKGYLLPLSSYKVLSRKGKKVKISVKKGGRVKTFKRAFTSNVAARSKGGEVSTHFGVFERVNSSRLPIRQLYGPSVPEMANNSEVKEAANKSAQTMFDKRFDHEVRRLLDK